MNTKLNKNENNGDYSIFFAERSTNRLKENLRTENPDSIHNLFKISFQNHGLTPLLVSHPDITNDGYEYDQRNSTLYFYPIEMSREQFFQEKNLTKLVPHNKFFKLRSTYTYIDSYNNKSLSKPKFIVQDSHISIPQNLLDTLGSNYCKDIILESIEQHHKQFQIFLSSTGLTSVHINSSFLNLHLHSCIAINVLEDKPEYIYEGFRKAIDSIESLDISPIEKSLKYFNIRLLSKEMQGFTQFCRTRLSTKFFSDSDEKCKEILKQIQIKGLNHFLIGITEDLEKTHPSKYEDKLKLYDDYIQVFLNHLSSSDDVTPLKQSYIEIDSIIQKLEKLSFFDRHPNTSFHFFDREEDELFNDFFLLKSIDSRELEVTIIKNEMFNDLEHLQVRNLYKDGKFEEHFRNFLNIIEKYNSNIDSTNIRTTLPREKTTHPILTIKSKSGECLDVDTFVDNLKTILKVYKFQRTPGYNVEHLEMLYHEKILSQNTISTNNNKSTTMKF